ncbi:MAG: MOSC domain-containing protein, partial [Planctomycetota bacterium]|nr:MOSC domain-containing protein [Planctomycetota bacterium]
GRPLDPAVRRANIVVSGLDLAQSIGRVLRVGGALVDVRGETRPCELMDDDGRMGLDAALRKSLRGGVFGSIRRGGELRVGDDAELLES